MMTTYAEAYPAWNTACEDTVTTIDLTGNEYYADGLPAGRYWITWMERRGLTIRVTLSGLDEPIIVERDTPAPNLMQERVTGRCDCDPHIYYY